MTIGRLNHIGIAVPSIEKTFETYRTLYGATEFVQPFDMPAQGVRVGFINMPNTQLEIIEPLGEKSPIINFLEKISMKPRPTWRRRAPRCWASRASAPMARW